MRVFFLVLLAGTLVSGFMAFRARKESPASSPGAGETTSSPRSIVGGDTRRNVDLLSSRMGADTGDSTESTDTVSDDLVLPPAPDPMGTRAGVQESPRTKLDGLFKLAEPTPKRRSIDQRTDAAARIDKMFRELRITDDPEPMTRFIHTCREQGFSAELLWQAAMKADEERSGANAAEKRSWDRILYGLLLSLGEFSYSDIPDATRYLVHLQTATWFRDDPSSAIHGASGWLLRHWGQESLVRRIERTPVPYEAGREWFRLVIAVDDQKFSQTYIVFPAGDYETGSPQDEPGRPVDKQRRTVRLTRPFAILDREITRAEFEASGIATPDVERSPTAEHPMVAVSWYESIRFCRWWTEQAGMSESAQCYFYPDRIDPNGSPPDPDKNTPGSRREWSNNFNRRGFRLPTEAEWEIAARAGMGSAYSFGNDGRLLGRYGWYRENSGRQTHVPRTLRPNLRGVFDVHGNAWEWCHDWYRSDPAGQGFLFDPRGPRSGTSRVCRGGGWGNTDTGCRMTYSSRHPPIFRYGDLGLRLALVPSSAE